MHVGLISYSTVIDDRPNTKPEATVISTVRHSPVPEVMWSVLLEGEQEAGCAVEALQDLHGGALGVAAQQHTEDLCDVRHLLRQKDQHRDHAPWIRSL